MKAVIKTIGAIFLIVLAIVLFVVITPFAFVWKVIVSVKRKTFDIGVSHYFIEIAASFDQLGNAVFGGFFNWLCIKKQVPEYYKFGDKDETISEVLGWNEHLNALSDFGVSLVFILSKLDANHCYKAMKSGVVKASVKLDRFNSLS